MQIRRRGVLTALIAVLFVAGCANSAGSPPGNAPDPAGSGSASPGTSASSPETISGTVVAGVEPGCLILQGNGSTHLLIIEDKTLASKAKVGASVTVVGTAKPSQMTTCQQGVPFVVTAVSAFGPTA